MSMRIIAQSEPVFARCKYIRPGIDPICGWDWLAANEHKYDGWTPTIEIDRPGSHFKFNVKNEAAMKAVSSYMKGK